MSKLDFGYGILAGFVISNLAMFFRLTNNKLKDEMIYYLQKGDLSIFLGLAYISFVGLVIVLLINLLININFALSGGDE